MPGQLSKDRMRISFAEERIKVAAMREIAGVRQISLSKIIREATESWLKNRAPVRQVSS